MKNIAILTLLILSFAGSAFATTVTSHSLIGAAGVGGYALYGGVDSTTASSPTANPLVRMSTGVQGCVNFPAAHNEYAIFTKHVSGSKYFGTANDSTNIFLVAGCKR